MGENVAWSKLSAEALFTWKASGRMIPIPPPKLSPPEVDRAQGLKQRWETQLLNRRIDRKPLRNVVGVPRAAVPLSGLPGLGTRVWRADASSVLTKWGIDREIEILRASMRLQNIRYIL